MRQAIAYAGLQERNALEFGGGELLDHLYGALQQSHGGSGALLRQLFASSFEPFAAKLRREVFSKTDAVVTPPPLPISRKLYLLSVDFENPQPHKMDDQVSLVS